LSAPLRPVAHALRHFALRLSPLFPAALTPKQFV